MGDYSDGSNNDSHKINNESVLLVKDDNKNDNIDIHSSDNSLLEKSTPLANLEFELSEDVSQRIYDSSSDEASADEDNESNDVDFEIVVGKTNSLNNCSDFISSNTGLATDTTISVNNAGNDQEDSDPTRATWMFRKFPELGNTDKGNCFDHNEDDTDDDEASSEEESLTWSD